MHDYDAGECVTRGAGLAYAVPVLQGTLKRYRAGLQGGKQKDDRCRRSAAEEDHGGRLSAADPGKTERPGRSPVSNQTEQCRVRGRDLHDWSILHSAYRSSAHFFQLHAEIYILTRQRTKSFS